MSDNYPRRRPNRALPRLPYLAMSLGFLTGCLDAPLDEKGNDAGPDNGGSDPSGPTACDPFDQGDIPTTLGEIIAVGQDGNGTIYVIDEHEDVSGSRAFVSDGGTLYRQIVGGSGSGTGSDGRFWSLTLEREDESDFVLLAEIDPDGNTTMAISLDDDFEGPITALDETGEILKVLDESAISGMGVQNLPNVIELEYYATVENGDAIVVTREKEDWDGTVWLFYGEESTLTERKVSVFGRADDGGSTYIEFDYDEETALLDFPVQFTEEGLRWEPASLTIGNDTLDVTRHEDDAFVAGDYAFICLNV